MKKEFLEYVTDMCAFYKKHRRFLMKIMAIYVAMAAAITAYGLYYWEISSFFQRIKMKILGKKEEELSSGGLDCEAPEAEEDNDSVVASF